MRATDSLMTGPRGSRWSVARPDLDARGSARPGQAMLGAPPQEYSRVERRGHWVDCWIGSWIACCARTGLKATLIAHHSPSQ